MMIIFEALNQPPNFQGSQKQFSKKNFQNTSEGTLQTLLFYKRALGQFQADKIFFSERK